MRLTIDQVLHLRLRGQGLWPVRSREDAPVAVARLSAGLQAQDLFAATLGVRVRASNSTLAEFERSRAEERSVVWTWLMRGTLHVIPTADLDWYLAVMGQPLIAATTRRRAELGLDDASYAAGLDVVLSHLAAHGPALRGEVGSALAAAGLPNGYSVERHLLFRAALEGRICFGPDRAATPGVAPGAAPGAAPTFTLLETWLGRPLARLTPDELQAATVRLAERYLAAFAPATLADFSAWSGLNIRDLRSAWEALQDRVTTVEVEGEKMVVPEGLLAGLDEPPPSPFVRLLPAFDTYILGHRSRSLIDDGAYAARYKGGGMLPPMILVDGRVAGTWHTNRKGRRLAITLDPFAPLSPEVLALADEELTGIERFLAA